MKSNKCAVPTQITLKKLEAKEHIGSSKNVSILMVNIADMIAYIENLEASIRCYNNKEK
ncbi:MAG: hypothetical protein ROM03_07825 [Mucispirillum sp.]|nr:hypothetical protein [Mucispirillum sp.]